LAHTGHSQIRKKGKATVELRDVVGRSLAVAHISSAQAELLFQLEEMAGGTVTQEQIRKLKASFLRHEAGGDVEPDQQLLKDLLEGEADGSLKHMVKLETPSPRRSRTATSILDGDDSTDDEDTHEPELSSSTSSKVSGVAFVTTESHRQALLNPDVVGFDVAMCTNASGKPMLVVICRDADNKMIMALTCYLWSQRREAFRWVFEEVIPYLYGREFCNRVCTFMADRDPQAAQVVDDLIAAGVYPNAFRKVCYFHLILQELLTEFGSSGYLLGYVTIVRDWCRRMAYVYETEAEAKYSWKALIYWVENNAPANDSGFVVV
jgi:hypothetical protein